RHRQLRVLDGKLRRGHRVLDEDVDFLDVLLLEVVQGIEPLDLAGDPGRKVRRVEVRDRGDAVSAGTQRRPVRVGPDADRREEAYAGDDHSSVHRASATSSWRAPRCTRWLPSRG